MNVNFRKFVSGLLLAVVALNWTSCSTDEEESIIANAANRDPVETAESKSGSTAIMMQPFTLTTGNWASIQSAASGYGSAGFTHVWFPPASRSADTYGYIPTQWYDYNNSRGSQAQLTGAINAVRNAGMVAVADVVVNHRGGTLTAGCDFTNPSFANNCGSIVNNDECGCGTGGNDTGDGFNAGRDLAHNVTDVQNKVREYIASMRNLGFGGCRFDMTKGFGASYARGYISGFSVGEYWDGNTSNLNNWANAAGMNAFDFPTYYSLQSAINQNNFSYLSASGRAPGLIGVNPGMSVTFAGNHDTGSSGLLANVYILTHPGIPCVYIEDWNVHSAAIRNLMAIRKAQAIGQTSTLSIQAATQSVYAAIIGGRVAMKIGPGSWSPGAGWTLAASGTNYAVWTVNGTGGGGDVTITLRMQKDAGYGNSIFFTGNHSTLTNWGTGVQGTWTTNNFWTRTITIPSGTTIEYKVRRGPTGGAGSTWESGNNHVVTNPTNGTTYTHTFNGGF